MFSFQPKVPKAGDLLPGRSEAMAITDQHYINGKNLKPPFAAGAQQAVFGLAAFGVRNAVSGNLMASSPLPWGMQGDQPQTRPITRSALA